MFDTNVHTSTAVLESPLDALERMSGVDRAELPSEDERLLRGILAIVRAVEDAKAGRL